MTQPQFELQVGISMEHDTGFSLVAYGSLVEGSSVNADPPDEDSLRRTLYALMDQVIERVKQAHH